MPRFYECRYVLMLVTAGLAICGAVVLGLDGSGLRAANGSTSDAPQRAKGSSEILGGLGARLELADAAETKPIEIENGGRAKHSSKGTLGGSGSDRSERSQQKDGAEGGSMFDTGVMPPWMHKKTPAVGSPEWKQEQQETERQEQEVRRAIDGICRGC